MLRGGEDQGHTNSIKTFSHALSIVKMQRPTFPVLLNITTYALNKSRSKYVSIGLTAQRPFTPHILLHGCKGDWIIFDEVQWNLLLEEQGVITNLLYTKEQLPQSILIGTMSAVFHQVGDLRVVTLKGATEVCLAYDTICELWQLLPLIEKRIKLLQKLRFPEFYATLIRAVAGLPDDYRTNIDRVINNLQDSEAAACVAELVRFAPQLVEADYNIELLINKAMPEMFE